LFSNFDCDPGFSVDSFDAIFYSFHDAFLDLLDTIDGTVRVSSLDFLAASFVATYRRTLHTFDFGHTSPLIRTSRTVFQNIWMINYRQA
jgi:hypothetical protein